jgi:DNA invertase Pin-like site-specific DNA recombinase
LELEMTAFVAYYRVSTPKQGASGLGIEAQKAAVAAHVKAGDKIVASFVEVESGKRNSRPELSKALRLCRVHHATLVIAKLDRLSRSVSFLASLLEGDVPLIATDMPSADRTMLQFMSVIAEHEARAISTRTRQALAQARERGVVLGGWKGRDLTDGDRKRAIAALKAQANERAMSLMPVLDDLRQQGIVSTVAIADALNGRSIPTPRGGRWHPASVARMVARLG